MTANNHERMKIVLSMKHPFDYAEFLQICEDSSVQPLLIGEYSMKVGFVMMAKVKYPDIPIEEAYMKICEYTNNQQPVGCSTYGDKKDKPLPGILTEAKNLAIESAKYLASGLKNVDEKTLTFRIDICSKCDNMRSDDRCAKCGCLMKLKAKWDAAKCPENKW